MNCCIRLLIRRVSLTGLRVLKMNDDLTQICWTLLRRMDLKHLKLEVIRSSSLMTGKS